MTRGSWVLFGAVGCGAPGTDVVDTDETDVVDTDETDAPDTDETDVVDTDTDVALCAERADGALITFDVAGESFTGWFTDDAFVDAAARHLADRTTQVPNFATVIAGSDCDAQWSFHVDPADVAFADLTIELCDATPSYVDANRDTWIASVGGWCPWSAVVVAVDDRR